MSQPTGSPVCSSCGRYCGCEPFDTEALAEMLAALRAARTNLQDEFDGGLTSPRVSTALTMLAVALAAAARL
jgi:hypothetical protein